jgi:hypothetical protein
MPRDDASDCAGLARLAGGVGGQGVPRVKRVLLTADAVGGVWSYTLDLATELADPDPCVARVTGEAARQRVLAEHTDAHRARARQVEAVLGLRAAA